MTDNKEIVRRIEEAWDRNDLDALDLYFAPDFDNAQSGTPGPRASPGRRWRIKGS